MYGPSIGVLNLRITRHGKDGEEPWKIIWARAGPQGNRLTSCFSETIIKRHYMVDDEFYFSHFDFEKLGFCLKLSKLS